ncbi:MAG: hypothetical protein Q9M30_06205 [Mariprofundaceae bacterium]|nr:hypothetical protein [Mariprofundaceae bacterium]
MAGSHPAMAKDDQVALRAPMEHLEGYVVRKGIADDYTVIFHVMRAPEGMRLSKEQYHLMVLVEKDGRAVSGMKMKSIVSHPNRTLASKPMVSMGQWYMALYDLNHEQGRHHISVHFEVSGKGYSADAYYPEIDFSEGPK